jgi:hypothetical protein
MTEQIEEKNMHLMQTLDDAWNSQDWDTFSQRHTVDCVLFWPGQPEPTKGVQNHKAEGIEFFKTFPDNHVGNRPYKIFFAQRDYTCSVADFTGTFKGPMKMGDKTIPPTGKELSGRILHSCFMEGRQDCRGEAVLRPGRTDEADRFDVAS